ncbi:unnamed protein product [Strongylus vulgaris]|uniref:Glycine zipper 2TM domain-containing protein n=1 Tax=Strongylus vulgaris TaxID=40348 RepID=A0A3P7IUG9_STRVU|nr:unnamed protein product [Strongylus vulgaris]
MRYEAVLLIIFALIAEVKPQYPDYNPYYGFPYGAPMGGDIPYGQEDAAGVDPVAGAIVGAITGGLMGLLSGGKK